MKSTKNTNPKSKKEGQKEPPATYYHIAVVQDITERKRAEALQEAVYRIAAAADATRSLDDLFPQIHRIISSVMPAENFYITLFDELHNILQFPYNTDTIDGPFIEKVHPGRGLTAYVLRTGKSLLCDAALHDQLERQGEIKLPGVPSAIWLGVPLIIAGKTIGVMAVQHYSDPKAYNELEQHILEFVSLQVATAITRKRVEVELAESEARFRTLVDDVNDGIYISDIRGLLTFTNRALAQILGFKCARELIGGDEFAVLLPGIDANPAEKAKQRIKETIKRQNAARKGKPLQISMGIGTAEKGGSLAVALKLADDQMYAEKQAKR